MFVVNTLIKHRIRGFVSAAGVFDLGVFDKTSPGLPEDWLDFEAPRHGAASIRMRS